MLGVFGTEKVNVLKLNIALEETKVNKEMNMRNIINKNTILTSLALVAMCFWGGINANAQQFNVQGDLVASYIWRGMYQTGVSIQPTLGFSAGGFSLTAWGSTDFDGTSASAGAAAKEIDLTAAYTLGNSGLTFSVADLWWAGQGARKYFNFKSHETAHHFEAGLTYAVQSEKFPLSIAWYTMFAGQDKNAEGKQITRLMSSLIILSV